VLGQLPPLPGWFDAGRDELCLLIVFSSVKPGIGQNLKYNLAYEISAKQLARFFEIFH
jgi:hypothetical protein